MPTGYNSIEGGDHSPHAIYYASILSSNNQQQVKVLGEVRNESFRNYKKSPFHETTIKIIQRQQKQSPTSSTSKTSYQHENVNIHILQQFNQQQQQTYFYLCIADPQVPLRICFALLERMKNDFNPVLADDFSAITGAINHQVQYCCNPSNDKIIVIQNQIQDAKNVMIQNIDKILNNMELMEILVEKTAELREDANTFLYKSKKVKNSMLKRNIIIISVIVIIVLMLLFAIIWFGCGFPSFYRCRSSNDN
ncbi:hypothetical protein ABK040_006307 [Willaertia magna]